MSNQSQVGAARRAGSCPAPWALLLFTAISLAGRGGSATPPPQAKASDATPRTFKVVLRDEAPYFDPKRLSVPRGSTVVWENKGPGLTHTIYLMTDEGVSRSGPLAPGQKWEHAFKGDAVVKASCEIHPYMFGVVVVGEPSSELVSAVTARLETPRTGESLADVIEFPLPVPNSVPGVLAIDAQDNVWVTMGGGGWANITHPPLATFARLTIDGDITIFTTPTAASGPSGLAVDADGNVWITELMGGKIGRFDPRRRAFDEFPIPTETSWPTGLAFDRHGNLWFNETKGDKVGRLSPEGVMVEFTVPTAGAHPTGMVVDHGGNVWIAERDASKVAQVRPDGTMIEYTIPTPRAKPAGMAVDHRGRVWFAEREGNKLAVIEDERIKEYPLPSPNSGPMFLAVDHDDRIWFTEVFANRIGVLVPETGRIVEFALPTKDGWPGGLAFDGQGNLWFTEQLANKVGYIPRATEALARSLAEARPASGSSHTTHEGH